MKHLIISVAGLSWDDVCKYWKGRLRDLHFRAAKSVFPAVTCTAQAGFRTATDVCDHGMVCNGVFFRELQEAHFWQQSSALVSGNRIWNSARKQGDKVAMLFWQQSRGEAVDFLLTPTPIHKHGGGMIMDHLTRPPELGKHLREKFGNFPLYRYWGPLAHYKVGDIITYQVIESIRLYNPEIVFAYLPTLDYDLQRFGPHDERVAKSFFSVEKQLFQLYQLAEAHGADITIWGDYAITQVTKEAAFPNRFLREIGYFCVRELKGMAYPDIHSSRAFAMVDHQVGHVYVRDPGDVEKVAIALESTGEYGSVEIRKNQSWAHRNAGEILLIAKEGSWLAYPWWKKASEAPDFASHVDIHSKPGFDPCELFWGKWFPPEVSLNAHLVRGTHGREDFIAYASTKASGDDIITIARSVLDTHQSEG